MISQRVSSLFKTDREAVHSHTAESLNRGPGILRGDIDIRFSRWREIFLIVHVWNGKRGRTIESTPRIHSDHGGYAGLRLGFLWKVSALGIDGDNLLPIFDANIIRSEGLCVIRTLFFFVSDRRRIFGALEKKKPRDENDKNCRYKEHDIENILFHRSVFCGCFKSNQPLYLIWY